MSGSHRQTEIQTAAGDSSGSAGGKGLGEELPRAAGAIPSARDLRRSGLCYFPRLGVKTKERERERENEHQILQF